jgi:hypothetical protein
MHKSYDWRWKYVQNIERIKWRSFITFAGKDKGKVLGTGNINLNSNLSPLIKSSWDFGFLALILSANCDFASKHRAKLELRFQKARAKSHKAKGGVKHSK